MKRKPTKTKSERSRGGPGQISEKQRLANREEAKGLRDVAYNYREAKVKV
jgi:hypothetical protein